MNTKCDRLSLRVPGSMASELDKAVERRRASRPSEDHSRNSVVKEALAALFAAEGHKHQWPASAE